MVKLLVAGLAPQEVVPHLCGATLLPCQKKNGGLRPIAIGEVLRRLTSKCLSLLSCSDAVMSLTPLQLGVGIKLGCEAILHSVSSVVGDISSPELDRWTLMLDFSNAFNISRNCMFDEIRERIPSLSPWMERLWRPVYPASR